jgi:formylglycine-generating enzyme required for sulfatase activity
MDKKIKNGVYIVKGREILTENLSEGDGVLLISDHASIIISKDKPAEDMNWDEAMKYCAGLGVNLPDRHQALEIAKFRDEINEALSNAGGQELHYGWYWTCEERSSRSAWLYGGNYGGMYDNSKISNYSVRPVTAF